LIAISDPPQTANASQTPIGYDGGATGKDPGGSDTGLIVGLVLGLLALIAIAVLFLLFVWRRGQSSGDYVNEYETEVERSRESVEYVDTEIATFEDDYENPLSAVGGSEGSAGIFGCGGVEEGVY
jgi:hypothetical protein